MTMPVKRHWLNISCGNAFAEEKITYIEDKGQLLCRSDMTYGKWNLFCIVHNMKKIQRYGPGFV